MILIDQRGMGHSQPGLFCNDGELTDECRARLVGNGVDLSQFHTAAIADDIELLRQSLGLDQINLFGFSYGTFLGQEILRRHPERIRSAVLDSCLPVAVATTAEGGPGALASFLNLIADCNSDPACRASYPEIENTLYAVLDRANTTPFEILLDGETVSAGPSMLVTSVFMALNSPSQINAIPKAIYDLAAGDVESTALATVLRSESNNMPYLDSQGAKISVKCHDILPFETYIEAKQNNASLNPYIASNYDLFALTGHTQCQVWQVRAADASFHYPVQSDVPTLVLGGEYDSLTRSAWSETVAATLSQSYYFSIPRTGHVTIQRDCPLEMAKSFLNNPSAVPNSSCLSEIRTSDFFELPSS
ncbi:MAG: alpha/beta hydrolase [Lentisphaerae bacterium]|nr:alpha/beta hydrolase [Lentisphaerota bacterium]